MPTFAADKGRPKTPRGIAKSPSCLRHRRHFFMALSKQQKQKIIAQIKEGIAAQKAMVFVNVSGLKVKDIFELKQRLRGLDSVFKVCKKTLLGLVFKEKKLGIEPRKLEGQLAVVFAFGDAMAPLKAVYNFSQENENLKILGGFLENKFQDKDYLIELAQLPPRQELFARLVSSMSAPINNLVYTLQANIKGLIYILAKAKT